MKSSRVHDSMLSQHTASLCGCALQLFSMFNWILILISRIFDNLGLIPVARLAAIGGVYEGTWIWIPGRE